MNVCVLFMYCLSLYVLLYCFRVNYLIDFIVAFLQRYKEPAVTQPSGFGLGLGLGS